MIHALDFRISLWFWQILLIQSYQNFFDVVWCLWLHFVICGIFFPQLLMLLCHCEIWHDDTFKAEKSKLWAFFLCFSQIWDYIVLNENKSRHVISFVLRWNRSFLLDWDIVFGLRMYSYQTIFIRAIYSSLRKTQHHPHITSQTQQRMKTQWRLLRQRHREWFEGVLSMHGGTICCIYFHFSSVGCKRTWQEFLDVYTYSCDWKHFVGSINLGQISFMDCTPSTLQG